MTEPRPYRPSGSNEMRPEEAGKRPMEVVIPKNKPWMALPDATHRCWKCGHFESDMDVLARHEDNCTKEQP
jgi:hypothetical protein